MAKAIKWEVTHDGKAISQMQSALNKSSGTLRNQRAILAASCVLYMLETGNATPMTRFVNEAGKDVRKDAIVKWALGLGIYRVGKAIDEATKKPIDVFKKNEQNFDAVLAEYVKDKPGYGQSLVDKPFFEVVKEKNPFGGFNALAKLFAILDEAKRVMADPTKKDHEKNDFRGIIELQHALTKHERPLKKAKKETVDVPFTVEAEAVEVHVN